MQRELRLKQELENYKNVVWYKRWIVRVLWILYKVPHFYEEIPIQEFWKKQYFRPLKKMGGGVKHNTHSYDQIISILNRSHEQISKRKGTLDDKVKNLLTLTGVSIPLVTIFLGKWPASFLGLIGLGLLLSTIFLLLTYWGIHRFTEVSVSDSWFALNEEEIKKEIIEDLVYSNHENNNTVDFLADLFRAARFYFVCALIFLVMNVVINNILNSVPKTPEEKALQLEHQSRVKGDEKCYVNFICPVEEQEKLYCPIEKKIQ